MEVPTFKLPHILPSSNSYIHSDRSSNIKLGTNSYEEWRANIHRELEEDLQRQVRELLEETDRQERLSKFQRQYIRVDECSPPKSQESIDTWNEINRRNENVLNPAKSKHISQSQNHFSTNNHHNTLNDLSDKPFYLNSYHSYRRLPESSQTTDDEININPSIYIQKYTNKQQSSIISNTNDSSILFGNSIIKSNKASILNIFDQQLLDGDYKNSYVNKHGIRIDEDGPFWPDNYQILHPTPKFLSRELIPKEFYLSSSITNYCYYYYNEQYDYLINSIKEYLHNKRFLLYSPWKINVNNSESNNRQTYDNQPAIYKYQDTLKHPIIVYDMDKSARVQQIKQSDYDQTCPQLIFESRFEGGNLRQVRRVGQFEYELILRPDLYTRRHTQWYYFRVQNMIANITYRFRIINLMKKSSLYSDGMQILLFSEVDAKKECRSWYRVGHHINYSETKQHSYNSLLERDINYYELDFQLEFSHSGDTCYIAHCYPYTYTDLKDDLEHLSTTRSRDIFRRDILCESQAGNSCFIITVTDESVPLHKKKIVFITARIHPGETNSSYMMRGLLEFITSNDKTAQKLRSELVFKIVPMLNPDGVIVGNYRCSLTGKDMNRNFRHPRKQAFPIIYHIKELIQNLQRERREILAFCDLHGHSRKSNVFAYGCDGCDGPQPDMKNFLYARVLPFIMSKTAPDMFAFDYCKFHIHRCKESTGRVVMWKEMLIKNSFTLEASFAGTSIVERPCHFNIQDYEKFGECICKSLKQYLDVLHDSTRLESIFLDITKNVLHRLDKNKIPFGLLPSLYPEEKQLNQSVISINSVSNCLEILTQCHEIINDQDASSSSDSDSDPEGGELPDIPYSKEKAITKKKSKKKRTDKSNEEHLQKSNRKRQMDKTTRMIPERGSLFTSKYAKRSGHGLPIFTTERALERRSQKNNSLLQDINYDQQLSDECDTDIGTGIYLTKSNRSQIDNSNVIDKNLHIKRTSSLVSYPHNELVNSSSNQIMTNNISLQTPIFQNLPQRRLKILHRFQQENTKSLNRNEIDQINNISPSIITMPHFMEFTRRLSRSSSINDNDITTIDTQIDSNTFNSYKIHETPILHTKTSINNSNINLKRRFSQKLNNHLLKQPLTSIDYIIKERPINSIQDNNYQNQSNETQRLNQILKKQFYLPFEKNKRL
ncbi:unnamed protein product [Rotaria sordida]|uniref:Peptidase M14 domain-containing protein n=1 Tax=Rotaria sordida TaxID=392033 RepID=A0A814D142_9BILA|nr:unnamed protein product [Rotaria sordida]CAF0991293.1 unnamed protein product [Rotaria sordida]